MDELNIPIFKKAYDLYKIIYQTRLSIPKQDRYVLWQKIETISIDVIEGIIEASALYKEEKLDILKKISIKLNLMRVFIRLTYDNKLINEKKYIALQQNIDEIGRMLGGWIKSIKEG
jgi:four helix bundle protein